MATEDIVFGIFSVLVIVAAVFYFRVSDMDY